MVCKCCLTITSGHRQCFYTRCLKPVASSLLMVDTASLLNIQKWPLLQESKQGLHGATTWYPTTFPLNVQKEPERQTKTPDSNALWDTMKQNSKWLSVNKELKAKRAKQHVWSQLVNLNMIQCKYKASALLFKSSGLVIFLIRTIQLKKTNIVKIIVYYLNIFKCLIFSSHYSSLQCYVIPKKLL